MKFSAVLLTAAAHFSFASAATFTIAVGENGGLTYDPPSVNASVGDTISFQFMAKNHTVTQSTFADPCTQMTTPALGIDSGFMPVAAGATEIPQWSFQVTNASAPLWFFCRQTGHCAKGMVFAVNPTAAKSFEAFQAAANATASATNTTSGTTGASSTGAGTATSPSASAVTSGTTTSGAGRKIASMGSAGMLVVAGVLAGVAF